MIEELRLTVARWKLGKLHPESLPALADRALEVGLESVALTELSTLVKPTLREAEPLLREVMRDLGIPEPEPEAAGMLLAKHYASLIVSGELSPVDGADLIWRDVFLEIGRPESLLDIVSAGSEAQSYEHVRPGNPSVYDKKIEECQERIRAEAVWLSRREDLMGWREVEEEFEADLFAVPKPKLLARKKGKVERKRYGDGEERLTVRLRRVDVSDGSNVEVVVDGDSVGDVEVAAGRGRAELSTKHGAQVPRVGEGSVVEVQHEGRTLLRGVFEPD